MKGSCGEEACEESSSQAAVLRLRRSKVLASGFSDEVLGHVFDGGEVGGSVIGADAALVVAEDHVHHPVEAVFDRPMAADDGAEFICEPHSEVMSKRVSRSILSAISRVLSTMMTPCSSGKPWRSWSQATSWIAGRFWSRCGRGRRRRSMAADFCILEAIGLLSAANSSTSSRRVASLPLSAARNRPFCRGFAGRWRAGGRSRRG